MTMRYLLMRLAMLLTLVLCLTVTACGGGGATATGQQPAHRVTITFTLQGSSATPVGSVDLTVYLPDGFVLATDNAGQPTANALAVLVSGATSAVRYAPATATAQGEVRAGIIKADGFAQSSDLMKISSLYPAGAVLPAANDFMVSVTANDLNGVQLDGISSQASISIVPVP